jgi:hypothetical protein
MPLEKGLEWQLERREYLSQHLKNSGLTVHGTITPQDLGLKGSHKKLREGQSPLGAAFNNLLVQRNWASIDEFYTDLRERGRTLMQEGDTCIEAPMLRLFLQEKPKAKDIIVFNAKQDVLNDVQEIANKNKPNITITGVPVDKNIFNVDYQQEIDKHRQQVKEDNKNSKKNRILSNLDKRLLQLDELLLNEDSAKSNSAVPRIKIIENIKKEIKAGKDFDTAVQSRLADYHDSDDDVSPFITKIEKMINELSLTQESFFYDSPVEKLRALKVLQEHLILFDLGLMKENSISEVIENFLNTVITEKNGELRTAREILGTQRRQWFREGGVIFKTQGDTPTLNAVYTLLEAQRKDEQEQLVVEGKQNHRKSL